MREEIASTTWVQLPPSSSFLRRAGGTAETCSGKNSNDANRQRQRDIGRGWVVVDDLQLQKIVFITRNTLVTLSHALL